jgi:hypothetical protein
MALLMDKYDCLDSRVNFCEGNIHHNLDPHNDKHNKSVATNNTRSTSQLRMHQRQSANTGPGVPVEVIDRLNNFQIQIDRIDCKTAELRDA